MGFLRDTLRGLFWSFAALYLLKLLLFVFYLSFLLQNSLEKVRMTLFLALKQVSQPRLLIFYFCDEPRYQGDIRHRTQKFGLSGSLLSPGVIEMFYFFLL